MCASFCRRERAEHGGGVQSGSHDICVYPAPVAAVRGEPAGTGSGMSERVDVPKGSAASATSRASAHGHKSRGQGKQTNRQERKSRIRPRSCSASSLEKKAKRVRVSRATESEEQHRENRLREICTLQALTVRDEDLDMLVAWQGYQTCAALRCKRVDTRKVVTRSSYLRCDRALSACPVHLEYLQKVLSEMNWR